MKTYVACDVKVACYLSAEFLIGPQLANNLLCLGIQDNARKALKALGQAWRRLGPSVDPDAPNPRLHQPHAVARGARNLGPALVSRAFAATARNHLRDQPSLPRRGPRTFPGGRSPRGAFVVDRRG